MSVYPDVLPVSCYVRLGPAVLSPCFPFPCYSLVCLSPVFSSVSCCVVLLLCCVFSSVVLAIPYFTCPGLYSCSQFAFAAYPACHTAEPPIQTCTDNDQTLMIFQDLQQSSCQTCANTLLNRNSLTSD